MVAEVFLDGRLSLCGGDCREVLAAMPENSVDACVTDPPYHLTSIVKRFGKPNSAPAQFGSDGRFARASRGFMGKEWDGGEIAFEPETWTAILRVLKPGAHLLAFGAPKNFGFMQNAIAWGGFEVRDVIAWIFGSGFPKSHNVGDGWGTALKPAYEPVILARKPISEKTVAANVKRWSTGAINIDDCRIEGRNTDQVQADYNGSGIQLAGIPNAGKLYPASLGRWPANVIHDGSEEVVTAFPESASSASSAEPNYKNQVYGRGMGGVVSPENQYSDYGSASRFFYTAKADSDDRVASKHPTVKPLDLMQYLVRLVTPKGGVVLDPFAGTGTTGEAAFREGMSAILIEREEEYQADIRRRVSLCMAGPDERKREIVKTKTADKPADHGPLFGGTDLMRGGQTDLRPLRRSGRTIGPVGLKR